MSPCARRSLRFRLLRRLAVLLVLVAQAYAARELPRVGGNAEGASAPVERSDGFFKAFVQAFMMIMVTELGDETFIIAALLAMRNGRLTVYSGAMAALTFMTVISTALGYVLPNIISRTATRHVATALYAFFGARLFYIAYKSGAAEAKEEVEEVEAKLGAQDGAAAGDRWRKALLLLLLTPAFVEALVLTFLAEWGDRSQIATITLAAQYDPAGVTLGAIAGHALCTGAAVLGGQLLAQRISQRTVAIAGGTLFFAFMLHNLLTSG